VWANRQALDTENWVNTSGQLLENEPIREALGLFIVDRLFTSADVEQRLREALPPQLDRLASPAGAGLKEVVGRNAPRVLGSQAALAVWEKANETAHSTLLKLVDGQLASGGVTLDLQELFREVAAGAGLPPGAADKLPPEVSTLVVVQSDQPDREGTARPLQDGRLDPPGCWLSQLSPGLWHCLGTGAGA
jgi:hypothetical protein